MSNITLCKDYSSGITVVNNCFIDRYMCEANDAQIKIYLYLLRHMGANEPFGIGDIADCYNYTEKDVLRALKYWDRKKLISLSFNSSGSLTCIRLLDAGNVMDESDAEVTEVEDAVIETKTADRVKMVDFSRKPSYTPEELANFKNDPDLSQLLFIAETYLNKMLRSDEISSILFMYDSYGFSADLIEYLIEYCANNKKKSIKYIESVAESWLKTGVTTVEEAKFRTQNAPSEVYKVFRAFGISGREPIEPEISYVVKWKDVYGMSIDLICEACRRTIMNIHSVSFEYADTILSNWKEASVASLEDVERADRLRAKENLDKPSARRKKTSAKSGTGDAFNGFSQRKYDYSELEKDALMQ